MQVTFVDTFSRATPLPLPPPATSTVVRPKAPNTACPAAFPTALVAAGAYARGIAARPHGARNLA